MNKLKGFPIFLVSLGFIALLETTNLYNGAFVKFWPLLLIIVGLVKIVNSFIENPKDKKIKEEKKDKKNKEKEEEEDMY